MAENHEAFTAEDFAKDSSFIRWVKHRDEETELYWQAFLAEHPEKRDDIDTARKIVSLLDFTVESLDARSRAATRNSLLSAIREEKSRAATGRNHVRKEQLLKIAAVVLVAIASVAIYRVSEKISVAPDRFTATSMPPQDTPTEERMNHRGQKSVLVLPDGSKVWLNVDSKLSYAKDFLKTGRREVQLDGEAFFSVVHNDSVPFIVQTSSSIRIEVLGTSFNVKSYQADQTVETTLVNGKVSIDKLEANGATSGNLILKPNQRAIYFKESNTLNVKEVNATNVSAWREDFLVFDETPFADVLAQLERWYDVTIHLSEEDRENVRSCTLTANIQHESLADVLQLLETSHRIGYSISGSDVFIYGKLCKD